MLFELCPKQTPAAATPGDDRHLMMINASPMEYGHCLLVPSVSSCLPQVLFIIQNAIVMIAFQVTFSLVLQTRSKLVTLWGNLINNSQAILPVVSRENKACAQL